MRLVITPHIIVIKIPIMFLHEPASSFICSLFYTLYVLYTDGHRPATKNTEAPLQTWRVCFPFHMQSKLSRQERISCMQSTAKVNSATCIEVQPKWSTGLHYRNAGRRGGGVQIRCTLGLETTALCEKPAELRQLRKTSCCKTGVFAGI